MKAIRIYGSNGHATVSLDEVAVPKPVTGEILIRVHALFTVRSMPSKKAGK
jgi:NADPH:quinone reductase-like Zn-dependent oxidoreductase